MYGLGKVSIGFLVSRASSGSGLRGACKILQAPCKALASLCKDLASGLQGPCKAECMVLARFSKVLRGRVRVLKIL